MVVDPFFKLSGFRRPDLQENAPRERIGHYTLGSGILLSLQVLLSAVVRSGRPWLCLSAVVKCGYPHGDGAWLR